MSGVERQGDAARRARAGRDRGGGGRARGRGRQLVHVGREQSGPAGHLQRVARDGLRPDHGATRARTSSRRATSRAPPRPAISASPRPTARSIRRACRGASWRTRRTARSSARARREFQTAFDKARRAVALGRLPPLAIRLSVPRRPRDDAGEPPPRRDAGQRRVLGRRRRRPVHGPRRARARRASRAAPRCRRSSTSSPI